jgi:hypothetical protein
MAFAMADGDQTNSSVLDLAAPDQTVRDLQAHPRNEVAASDYQLEPGLGKIYCAPGAPTKSSREPARHSRVVLAGVVIACVLAVCTGWLLIDPPRQSVTPSGDGGARHLPRSRAM